MGARPIQLPKCRPDLKICGSGTFIVSAVAPQGAILKRSAADRNLFEREGRAVVFSALEDLSNRIRLSVSDRKIDLLVDDAELARRRKEQKPSRGGRG